MEKYLFVIFFVGCSLDLIVFEVGDLATGNHAADVGLRDQPN